MPTDQNVPANRAEQLMIDFYASKDYDPKAARPADVVKAAIAFTLTRLHQPIGGTAREVLGAKLFDWIFERFCEGDLEIEISDIVTGLCVDAGAVEKVAFDPEHHIDTSYTCEPGDDYWQLTETGRQFRMLSEKPTAALTPVPIEAGEVESSCICGKIPCPGHTIDEADALIHEHMQPTPSASSEVNRKAVARIIGEASGTEPWWWKEAFDDASDEVAERLRDDDRALADRILALLPPTGNSRGEGKLHAHFEKMQAMCMRYLMPEPYTDLQGETAHQAEFARAHRDRLFIGDMIYMLDGPEQREAQHG